MGFRKADGTVVPVKGAHVNDFTVTTYAKDVDKSNKSDILKSKIESGELPLKINHEKQARHIKSEKKGYEEGRSYLTISEKEAQEIVNKKYSTGEIYISPKGQIKEVIICDKDIGVKVDKDTKNETSTNSATIHYSKTGTHLVPAKRKEST